MTSREEHAYDWTPAALIAARRGAPPGAPRVVEYPSSTGDVVEILRAAHAEGTPVVPFGGGSSVVSGIVAEDAIVVDLRRMDRVLDIDSKSRLVVAQAGIGGATLAAALESEGLRLGHEPQSIELSTLGGWIATRAVGQLSARFGGIEDLVVGLEAVLPGGRVVRAKAAPRRSTGPDLASVMIGSEGVFGIVTEATVRVRPTARERVDRAVRFDHMTDGVAACRRLAQGELEPTVVRLYDTEDSSVFLRHHPEETAGPLLILSFEGRDAAGRADAAVVESGGAPGGDSLAAHWWEHRNDAVEEFRRVMAGEGVLGPHAVIDTMEVAGTWTVLRALYHTMKEALSAEALFAGCHLSHIYPDGACLYFTMGSMCEDDHHAAHVNRRWWQVGMRACLDAGGTISHHHGIGRLRAPWIREELGEWHAVLSAIKRAVDPKGIMNPGVLGL